VADQREQSFGAPITGSGERLDARAAHPDERKLGSNKKSVCQHEEKNE
jgi:hypothetical protein